MIARFDQFKISDEIKYELFSNFDIYLENKTLLINIVSLLIYLYFIVFKFRNNYSILK